MEIHLWEASIRNKIPEIDAHIASIKNTEGARYDANSFGRIFGRKIRTMGHPHGAQEHRVQVELKKAGQPPVRLFDGFMRGHLRLPFPEQFSEKGDVVYAVFGDYGRVILPLSSGLYTTFGDVKLECGQTHHVHGIDGA
jgi:hypothetical protein